MLLAADFCNNARWTTSRRGGEGGTDALSNLQCICADCHAWKTAQESNKTGRRPVGLDGWPV
ncbi:HNH endonuclease signature motif containing protein [Gemmobacter megaterium]|uniref:HNH endonuclease signature motif containing protein n=1 Tax=Gemmobacter megaterium TaxID=1086013 RepID=UPI0009FA4472